MNFEKLYSKLPDFIKYNNFILKTLLKVPKFISKLTKKSQIEESQSQLFELIFLNSNFEVTGTSRNIQLLYIELLKFVDNVCKKHDIDYWLTDGTLLGAVRHGGFIPWDDDIDLAMLREDYLKLIEVLPEEISNFDYLKENCGLSLLRENHENYFKDFKSVYDFEGDEKLLDEAKFIFLQIAWLKPYVKIDFFPKDFILEDKLDYFKKNYRSNKYKFNQNLKNGVVSYEKSFNEINHLLGFTNQKTNFVCDAIDTLQLSDLCIYETNKIFPLETINFEGHQFKCPNDFDYYLKQYFGNNYMRLPKIIETHNVSKFIQSQFQSKTEMDEAFKKDIEYLKKVNDSFNL
jgi:lipopolysaccharide cholinephosphotransferase